MYKYNTIRDFHRHGHDRLAHSLETVMETVTEWFPCLGPQSDHVSGDA